MRSARLEIDTAATEFPIAKTRRLRSLASADFLRAGGRCGLATVERLRRHGLF